MTKKIERKTHILDASGQILGRFATQIAILLIGKHKVDYTPNIDAGDRVVVKNAAKIKVTGKKVSDKLYRHHTNYPGGLKEENFQAMQRRDPRRIISLAVSRMLPKNRTRKVRMSRLKIEA